MLLGLPLLATACTAAPPPPPPPATGPVDVAPLPATDAASARPCASLLEALPAQIDPGVLRRPVTGASERVAVYGEPPVVVSCGVPEVERITEQAEINGVPWAIRDSGAGFTWTTIGRTVAVQVVLPDAYEANGFAELIVPLSDAVTAAVPVR